MWKRQTPRGSEGELRAKYAKEKSDRYYGKQKFGGSYLPSGSPRSIIFLQLLLLFCSICCCIYYYIENNTNKSLLFESQNKIRELTDQQSSMSEQLSQSKQQILSLHKEIENKHSDNKNNENNNENKNDNNNNNNNQEDDLTGKLKKKIQENALKSNKLRYNGANQVKVELDTNLGIILLELAPFDIMPHVTNYFLNLVESGYWNNCHFFRAASHVIQANCHHKTDGIGDNTKMVGPNYPSNPPSLIFQEYNEDYLHNPFTIGIAGRPGGPDFYINLVDNIKNHGPGGQGPEPDPCFGKVIKGFDVIEKIKKLKLDPNSSMMVLQDDQWVKFNKVTVISD